MTGKRGTLETVPVRVSHSIWKWPPERRDVHVYKAGTHPPGACVHVPSIDVNLNMRTTATIDQSYAISRECVWAENVSPIRELAPSGMFRLLLSR